MSETVKPFAAYDVDGVVFKSSLAEKVVDVGVAEKLFRAETFNRVYENRKRWQENNNEGTYQAYLHRLVGALVSEMAGVEVARFDGVVSKMIEEHKVRRFKFPRLLMQALSSSHANLAISGSPRIIVEPFLAGLPLTEVYGSEFEIKDGVFTGIAKGVGDKAVILQGLVHEGRVTQSESVAMGDTVSDKTALAYAEHPIMFNPSRTLANHGQKHGWLQVIEVKDRILPLRFDIDRQQYVVTTIDDVLETIAA